MTPLQIILIEDNPSFRRVISMAIEEDSELQVTAEFGTAEIALRELSQMHAKPDLCLLDLNLPGMSGHQALPHILEYAPDIKVLILSNSNAEADILKSIANGASGYLLKSSGIQDIRNKLKETYNGGSSLDPNVAKYLVDLIHRSGNAKPAETFLTKRELDVLKLLAEGKLKKEISHELAISYSTVDTHVRHIYDKLNARNAPAAISIAHKLGLLS